MTYYAPTPDIPEDLVERAKMLEGIMTAAATGGENDETTYSLLRREFMQNDICRDLLPAFVRQYRSLSAFWPFIKHEDGSYAGRRQIISEAFTPLIDYLEGADRSPSDGTVADAFAAFGADAVSEMWAKALARRSTDPEGAITAARTLMETVCKHILDERGIAYADKDDLPKLYGKVATELNLAPCHHTAEPVKMILGGVITTVNGLGTLRNRLSDAHGRGKNLPVKPAARHASLAVNAAGALATFLVETHLEREG